MNRHLLLNKLSITRINTIEILSQEVNIFYINSRSLQKIIDDLIKKGHLKDININIDDYTLASGGQYNYTICTTFTQNSDQYKRYKVRYGAYNNLIYKKRMYCFNYEIKKQEKNYKNVLVSEHLKIEQK